MLFPLIIRVMDSLHVDWVWTHKCYTISSIGDSVRGKFAIAISVILILNITTNIESQNVLNQSDISPTMDANEESEDEWPQISRIGFSEEAVCLLLNETMMRCIHIDFQNSGDYVVNISSPVGLKFIGLSEGQYYRYICAQLDDGSVRCYYPSSRPPGEMVLPSIGNEVAKNRMYNHESDCFLSTTGLTKCKRLGSDAWINIAPNNFSSIISFTQGVNSFPGCIVSSLNNLACWNDDYYHANWSVEGNQPMRIVSELNSTVKQAYSGDNYYCALLVNDSVTCWGNNDLFQLGVDTLGATISTPGEIYPFENDIKIIALRTTIRFSCAMTESNELMCWGFSPNTLTIQKTPTIINFTSDSPVIDFSIYPSNICALHESGDLSCMGHDLDGSLGESCQENYLCGPTIHDLFSKIDCPAGTYGIYQCIDAEKGHFVPNNSSIIQNKCPIGYWQNLSAQQSCKPANSGNYVPIEGADIQLPCSVGTWQNLSGQSNCILADAGHFVSFDAESIQYPCPIGTFQPNLGSGNCLSASLGYYVPNEGMVLQLPCSVGTYSLIEGQSYCNSTSPGNYSNSTTSAPIQCAKGTFQPQWNQSSCQNSPIDTYVDIVAAKKYTNCPLGLITIAEKSIDIEQCFKEANYTNGEDSDLNKTANLTGGDSNLFSKSKYLFSFISVIIITLSLSVLLRNKRQQYISEIPEETSMSDDITPSYVLNGEVHESVSEI